MLLRHPHVGVLIVALLWFSTHSSAAQTFPFVIPSDDALPTATSRAALLDGPIAPEGDRVQIRDGHFFRGEKRLRLWGVNICFGACFPSHEQAEQIAAHLAKLGVNAVRFHHLEMLDAPDGIWQPIAADGIRHFDPDMVDRFDYFLAQLHQQGIYANLNLHVSRTLTEAEGFPPVDSLPTWATFDRWTSYYHPAVQRELKRYAYMLMMHRNPYRDGRRRVDDAGIAHVELLNEDSFSQQGTQLVEQLPDFYRSPLIELWNHWLLAKYGSQASMQSSWMRKQPKIGPALFPVSTWKESLEGWTINRDQNQLGLSFIEVVVGDASTRQHAIRVAPQETTEHNYQQQLRRSKLTMNAQQPLALSYWVRSDQQRSYEVELSTISDGEWRELGLFESLDSGPKWKLVEINISPPITADDAALAFNIGLDKTPIEFAAVNLRKGNIARPIPANCSIEAGNLPLPEDLWPREAFSDLEAFLIDTELAWSKQFKTYLRELGVTVPISVSQVGYSHPRVIDEVSDYVDMHHYWHHPIFAEGREWDDEAWTVGNDSLAANPFTAQWPTRSLLLELTERRFDKPFVLSEWNYPEPSPYSVGSVPYVAMLAALKDWDGVYFFEYDSQGYNSQGDDASQSRLRDHVESFFAFNGQPLKLAALSSSANLFLRGDLTPLRNRYSHSLSKPNPAALALTYQLGTGFEANETATPIEMNPMQLATSDQRVRWTWTKGRRGWIQVQTPRTIALWGTIGARSATLNDIHIKVEQVHPDFGVVMLSSTDGLPIDESSSVLLFSAAHCQNTDVRWNEAGNSVGRNWGHGPTLVTALTATISLPFHRPLKCYALDEHGRRRDQVELKVNDEHIQLQVSAADRTIWYELVPAK